MTITTISLHYSHHNLEAFEMDAELWLRVGQIAPPLGLSSEREVRKIYERNPDDFGGTETRLITVPTDGGSQTVRVFSLRGARMLGMLARTGEARAFRRWVLDVLEGKINPRGAWAKPATRPLSSDAAHALSSVLALLGEGDPAHAKIQAMLETGAGLPDDARLSRHAAAWQSASDRMRTVSQEFTRIRALAARDGYSEEAVKAEVRRRKHPERQRQFVLEAADV